MESITIPLQQHPNTFSDEQRCVLYASTFLTGTASQWFSNFLIQDPLPPVVTNWNTFVRELNDIGRTPPSKLSAHYAIWTATR